MTEAAFMNIWIIGGIVWFLVLSFGIRFFIRRWEFDPFPVALMIVLSSFLWPISALTVLSYIIINFKNDWF